MFHQLLGVVYQIALHSVYDLEAVTFIQRMVGIREGLDTAMVRDCNGGHPPFFCPFDDVLYLGNAVHIAHFGMTVEFHTLFNTAVYAFAGKVLSLFNTYNRA